MEMQPFNGKKPVKKSITEKELNEILFDMIGLSLTSDGVVMDDDLGYIITIKGKYMVKNELLLNETLPNLILYDPVNNPSIMDKLFKHYLHKYCEENGTDIKYITSVNSPVLNKSYLEVVQTDGTCIRSGTYYNDNIKCADIIIQLNCSVPMHDLHELDKTLYEKIQKLIEEKKRGKRGGRRKKEEPKPDPIRYDSINDWLDSIQTDDGEQND